MPRLIYSFSEFKFDADTGTLTRRSRESRLPEQTARLLQVLLERSNALVSREEIEQALWPEEQFVNHDQGINVAINRLRQILRDDSKHPQFLRTIPKRGYSFCGDVRVVLPEVFEVPGTKDQPVAEEPVPDVTSPVAHDDSAAAFQETQAALWAQPASVLPEEPGEVAAGSAAKSRLGIWLAFGLAAAILVTAGGLFFWLRRPQPAAHILRIGIGPLQVSDDAQSRNAGESFRLKLSDAVSRLPGVQVPAAAAFMSARAEDLPRIARDLNLDDLLLGSISKQEDQYDLKFELVRAADATHLGSFEYSGQLKDLPAICERLQRDIFHYMQFNAAPLQLSEGSTNDPQAYEFYLQGEYYVLERDPESLRRALTEFNKATARDANFAAAYAGMATAYLRLSEYDTDPKNGLLGKAEQNAQLAVKIDPLLARAHAVLGTTAYKQDRDFARGESELREAIRIDPTQAAYRNWLAVPLVEEGRFDEALEQLSLAENKAPFLPSVYAIEGLVGVYARRNAVALKAAHHYVDLLPNLPIAHNTMAWVDFETKHYEDAIKEWRQMALLQNDAARVDLEDRGQAVLRSKGPRAFALFRLEAIRQKRGTRQVNDFMPAEWYACAGEREKALVELERLAATNDPYILHVGVDPLYDSLHQEPRFLAVLSRSGVRIPPSLEHVDSHLCE
jgi:DNA-binding winged helix-turn-helix (wHTH) protein/Tfp pilus assembly protein PilF/TolB-like protein